MINLVIHPHTSEWVRIQIQNHIDVQTPYRLNIFKGSVSYTYISATEEKAKEMASPTKPFPMNTYFKFFH